jgi:hypothetical protein
MGPNARFERGGGDDPYQWLRRENADFTREVEAVTRMELGLPPDAPENDYFAGVVVDTVYWQLRHRQLSRVNAMPAEFIVVSSVFELMRRFQSYVPMEFPYPPQATYSVPPALQSTTYTYERGLYRSNDPRYRYYEHHTVTRSVAMPYQKPRTGRVDVLLAQPHDNRLWYSRPLFDQSRSAGDEIKSERVYIEAHGTRPNILWLN